MGCGGSKAEQPKNVTLHYFDLYARGEVIRMALKYTGIAFIDDRIRLDQWPAHDKTPYEFGKVPCLEIDNMKLVTTRAILRYICMKKNLYPKDRMQIWKVESLCDFISDLFEPIGPLIFENKTQEIKNYYEEKLLPALKVIEKRLKENKSENHFVGNKTSMVDLVVFQFLHDFYVVESRKSSFGSYLDKVPSLKRFVQNFINSSGALKEYLDSREPKPF
mmetsp:Transcript_5697/g.8483  ORF Transcript_5697/g.8483 Transcript_5697/m.8483 type:complete len:219 (+) Transcript_5697:18-674(+)